MSHFAQVVNGVVQQVIVAEQDVIDSGMFGIVNGNGVGNIGSSTTYFNTVFAKATSAQYADLAEIYCADGNYAPGTVSVVGTVRKGDRLVSSDQPGVAQALDMNLYEPGCIVGKALEDYNSAAPGVIEVAVGRT